MYHESDDQKRVVKTITLSGSDLGAVTELLTQLVAHCDQWLPITYPSQIDRADLLNSHELMGRASAILASRRYRTSFFKTPMFGEPAWEMLLALYGSHLAGPRQSVGRLCEASGAPATTALRWLDYLEREQLVLRKAHPTDRRSELVSLTEKGRSAMEQYLSGTPLFNK